MAYTTTSIPTVWLMLFLKVCTICPWGLRTSKASYNWSHDSAVLLKQKSKNTGENGSESLAWQAEYLSTPTQRLWLQWFWLYSVGGTPSLLQREGSDAAREWCTLDCTCTLLLCGVSCTCPILWLTVRYVVSACLGSVCFRQPNFFWLGLLSSSSRTAGLWDICNAEVYI